MQTLSVLKQHPMLDKTAWFGTRTSGFVNNNCLITISDDNKNHRLLYYTSTNKSTDGSVRSIVVLSFYEENNGRCVYGVLNGRSV